MGLFGAIGRETRGAIRSLGYDLRRSRRFRRAGAIAVVAVAGGMIATGALLREPVPGLQDLADEGSDITEGWFGLGADTTGQDAESSSEEASQSPSAAGEAADPEASELASSSESRGRSAAEAPGLVPVGGETADPVEEGGESATPTLEPTEEPTEEPTTDAPTETPTEEPTTDAPTTVEPTPSASVPTTDMPTASPATDPTDPSAPVAESADQAPRGSSAPIPRKNRIG
ncbi:hypothetical protein [Glycomyces algeriensis]|uniref:Uncharacterized protein n=1 Tax=Glycomyces algeriensis TaxID=256037 RepID=A0A9W6GAC6_9ACTN|nr:hypothetical protein [Glycomyces algeriensis]MDA1366706.1 hypothetical protein [Glycomyces algeriensis]MDR7351593.1 hypothetical protein [Glycomyces algeriensis]GLI44314.1 hypothetical protein GALLR39Z86_41640 [Glycomyces algeriensis]